MIGGIFGTIGKTLGIGKEKYFLELDDAAEESVGNIKAAATKATKVATKTAKSAASEIADKAQDLAGDAADKAQDAAAKTQAKAKAVVADVKTNAKGAAKDVKAQANAVADDSSAQGKQAEKGAKAAGKPAENTVKKTTPAAPSAREPEDIIRAAIAAGGKPIDASGKVVSGPSNFSTDYLMMPTGNSGRRRPGPSLSPFKDMAKQTNPRLKS